MSIRLYIEAIRKNPKLLEGLDIKLKGGLDKCPDCKSPMLTYSSRFRLGYKECICPTHGLVLVNIQREER